MKNVKSMCESQYIALKGMPMNKPMFFIGNRVEFNEKVEVNYIDNMDIFLKSRQKKTFKRRVIRKLRNLRITFN